MRQRSRLAGATPAVVTTGVLIQVHTSSRPQRRGRGILVAGGLLLLTCVLAALLVWDAEGRGSSWRKVELPRSRMSVEMPRSFLLARSDIGSQLAIWTYWDRQNELQLHFARFLAGPSFSPVDAALQLTGDPMVPLRYVPTEGPAVIGSMPARQAVDRAGQSIIRSARADNGRIYVVHLSASADATPSAKHLQEIFERVCRSVKLEG